MSLLVDALGKQVREAAEASAEARALFRGRRGGRARIAVLAAAVMLLAAAGLGGWLYWRNAVDAVPADIPSTAVGRPPAGGQPAAASASAGAAAPSRSDTEKPGVEAASPQEAKGVQASAVQQVRQDAEPSGLPKAGPPRPVKTASRAPRGARPGSTAPQEVHLKADHFLLARQADDAGDHRAAERHYAEAIRIEPMNRSAVIGRARSLARLGETAAAERLYEGLLANDPRDADAMAGLALLRGGADPAGWRARLEAAIEARPDHAGLRAALGAILAGQKQWLAAARAFAQAAELDHAADIAYNAAVCWDRAGKAREALAAYRRALEAAEPADFDRRAVAARVAELEGAQ